MASNKGTASSGTTDVRVNRIEEGVAGFATVANPTASPVSINTFDAGKSVAVEQPLPVATIDTSGTSGNSQAADIKRGSPAAWV